MRGLASWRRFICALAALCVIGCAPQTEGPPRIRLGKDACAECGMIIADERFAAASRDADGDDKFDDIGCLALFGKKNPQDAPRSLWVRDYRSGEWIEVSRASFAHSGDLVTPMGSGLAAFSSREAAQEFAGRGEGIFSWSGVPVLDHSINDEKEER